MNNKMNDKMNDKMNITLKTNLIWGLTSEDREVLCNKSNEMIITNTNTNKNENENKDVFFENLYETLKNARLAKGDNSEPFFWITK